MENIRILALDDDNHSICFASERHYWSDAAEFIKDRLAAPHTDNYEIRMITLIDYDESVDDMFDRLSCCYRPSQLDAEAAEAREEAFNKLWEIAKEDFYV